MQIRTLTVSGALTQTADITIDVATNKTLTYSGISDQCWSKHNHFKSGGGSLVSGGMTLNNANSKLLLNSITLDSASTSANSLGIDVDANSTVTSLSVGHITPSLNCSRQETIRCNHSFCRLIEAK